MKFEIIIEYANGSKLHRFNVEELDAVRQVLHWVNVLRRDDTVQAFTIKREGEI